MSNVERILRTAKSDVRLQTIVNNYLEKLGYFQKVGYIQHLVFSYTFKEEKDDSPAFCLGLQILNFPLGGIFVSEDLMKMLTQEELEFVVLHEMGHIIKNHFVGTALIWLLKSWIIDIIADTLEISKQEALKNLEWLKAIYVLFSGKKTVEEEAKAKLELEADNFAIMTQGRKDPSISTLLKLSKGKIRAPTHVTYDGRFPFPIITYEERIEAIRRDRQ